MADTANAMVMDMRHRNAAAADALKALRKEAPSCKGGEGGEGASVGQVWGMREGNGEV